MSASSPLKLKANLGSGDGNNYNEERRGRKETYLWKKTLRGPVENRRDDEKRGEEKRMKVWTVKMKHTMSLTLTAAAALLFSSRRIQPDTLDSGTLIHTQVEGGQRGNQALRGCDSTGAEGWWSTGRHPPRLEHSWGLFHDLDSD